MTSSAKADGRFGKEDFVYLAEENVYRCPAGEKLTYRYTSEEHGLKLHRYWTNACRNCSLKSRCTPSPQRHATRRALRPASRACAAACRPHDQ